MKMEREYDNLVKNNWVFPISVIRATSIPSLIGKKNTILCFQLPCNFGKKMELNFNFTFKLPHVSNLEKQASL